MTCATDNGQVLQDDEDEDMSQQFQGSPGNVDYDGDERMADVGERNEISQMIKNLVRYALACEYSRTPIRRDGIREKGTRYSPHRCEILADVPLVLGANGREFKPVFAGAQTQLRATFGMEMVELPTKDRSLLSMEQKRRGMGMFPIH